MASVDVVPQNVTVVDDRAGNHFWIFTVPHVSGDTTDILVENSIISASELTADGTRGADVQVTADESATDAEREITIAGGATRDVMICARFSGVAGTGSGHEDL